MPKDVISMLEIKDIKPNSVIVIAGPTASGKSALAIEVAKKYNGVIINADASQVYQGISIISAAPTAEDKKEIEHLLYEIFPPQKNGTVTEWLDMAVAAIRETWQKGKTPIVVGGTGFYIESLVAGVSPIPETSPKIKKQVAELLNRSGVDAVYTELEKVDAAAAQMVKPKDTTRVRRALEIFLDTGKSIAEWFDVPMVKKLLEADFKIFVLLPELKNLEAKCAERFDKMMKDGALDEVKKLMALHLDANLPAMKAIGVAELSDFLRGKSSEEEAVNLAKLHTRQYAKRQLTWFRNRMRKTAEIQIINS